MCQGTSAPGAYRSRAAEGPSSSLPYNRWISTPGRSGFQGNSPGLATAAVRSNLNEAALTLEPPQDIGAARRPADDCSLGTNHLEGRDLERREVTFGAVLDEEAIVAPVIGLAHRGLHAAFGGHSGDDQRLDAAAAQLRVELRGVKRALSGFGDHQLAR